MKKLLIFLLTLALLLSCLSACNDEAPSDTPTDNPTEDGGNTGDGGNTVPPKKEAYTFTFVSNGDDTCYIDGVQANTPTAENAALIFPDRSPSGDVVTEIRQTGISVALPQVIEAEIWETYVRDAFDEKLAALEETFGNDSDEYMLAENYLKKLDAWYLKISKDIISPYFLEELRAMGLGELLDAGKALYILDIYSEYVITTKERAALYQILNEYTGYTRSETVLSATERALAAALPDSVWAENVRTMDAMIDPLKITSITLPASVTKLSDIKSFVNLQEIRFGGTLEEWQAVEKVPGWISPDVVTVICTDVETATQSFPNSIW